MKGKITGISNTCDNFSAYYNQQTELTIVGYQEGVEFTLTIKAPSERFNDLPDLSKKELDVSVSFDEYVSTIKTTKLI